MAILSTLCYISKEDHWLMLHRTKKKNDLNSGKWIGIGGKFEEGESPEECLIREVFEETGLTLERYFFRGIVTFVSDCAPTEYMHLFTADCPEGTLRNCEEGDLHWIAKEKVPELPTWAGDRVFLELLMRNEPFFSLKLCYQGEKLTQILLNGQIMPYPLTNCSDNSNI